MTDCEPLIRPALESAFSNEIRISSDQGDCRVEVPFERSDRDAITIWVIEQNNTYRITDEGETYGMLYLSNINLDQERRANRLNNIKSRFDLDSARREVALTASREQLGSRLLDAVQAIQAISYLSYTRQQYTQNDFKTEVGDFLTESGIYYDRNADITGASNEHIIDFHIYEQPQPTYLQAIHAENESDSVTMAERTGFKWTDISKHSPDVRRISVLDDESGEYDSRAVHILQEYSDAYVPWSNREQDLTRAITG